MTLREMLALVQGPVRLVIHETNGTVELPFTATESGPQRMLSLLEACRPWILNAPVSSVNSENSPLRTGMGSFFNDGPAFTVIHITRSNTL